MDTTENAEQVSYSRFLRLALDALSVRAARWLTLILSFALFGYASLEPTWPRLAIAATFTALVHCPLWLRKDRA